MEAETLTKITELVTTSQAVDLTDDAAALPNGVVLHDLEKYHKGPRRFRGQMKTNSIADFSEFADEFGTSDESLCFIDQEKMSSRLIVDAGSVATPLHCEFDANLTLEKTAGFVAAMNMVGGQAKTQKDFAEFMEDWNTNLKPIGANGEPYPLPKAIQAIRAVSIEEIRKSDHSEQSLKTERTAMESIEAKSVEQMPALLLFTCIPYHGLPEREIKLRVSILTSHDKPMISVSYPHELVDKEEMATEFKTALRAAVTENIKTYIGTFSRGERR